MTMAQILDGKKISEEILSELKNEITRLSKPLKLGIVLIGENPGSLAYVNQKKKTGARIGVEVKIFQFPEDITTKKLRAEVGRICRTLGMSGVIVQLPLPENINTQSILNAVLVSKDVDVLSQNSAGKLYLGTSPILPPTIAGAIRLLDAYAIEIKGKHVVIIGYGKLVGKPATVVFGNMGASISVARSSTTNLQEVVQLGDIVFSGVGKARLITKEMIKPGAVVIDAGYMTEGNKAAGDVAEDVQEVASWISPVPGGIGPMTVAMLFWNLVQLAK